MKVQPTRGGVTLAEPAGTFGPDGDLNATYRFGRNEPGSTVSAFGGYFVLANGDGAAEPNLTGDSTIDDLYATAGVPPVEAVDVAVTPTASETFAASLDGTTAAERAAVADAVTAALADSPERRTAIRENVSAALDAAPDATVRAALDAASDEEAAAILAAIDDARVRVAASENATTLIAPAGAPTAGQAVVAP